MGLLCLEQCCKDSIKLLSLVTLLTSIPYIQSLSSVVKNIQEIAISAVTINTTAFTFISSHFVTFHCKF